MFNVQRQVFHSYSGREWYKKIHRNGGGTWHSPLMLPTMIQCQAFHIITWQTYIDLIDFWCFSATFSYIMATRFSGGRSRSTWREPSTMGKQLVNFITCGCESSAPFIEGEPSMNKENYLCFMFHMCILS
jgi:hypothetical protein